MHFPPYLSWSTWLRCCANPEFLRCFAKKSFLCVHTPLRAFHLCRSRSTTLVTKTWRKTSTQRKTSLLLSRDSLTGWQQLECNFKWRSMARFNQLKKSLRRLCRAQGLSEIIKYLRLNAFYWATRRSRKPHSEVDSTGPQLRGQPLKFGPHIEISHFRMIFLMVTTLLWS